MKALLLILAFAGAAHADVTYLQETYPGTTITNPSRGYVTMPAGGGFTQVIPTDNGIQDRTRPGYLVGPSIGSDVDDLRRDAKRLHELGEVD